MEEDARDRLWAKLEQSIQHSAAGKDKGFRLVGEWKSFLRLQNGFKVYKVDPIWVRNNLSITFGHGGHGYVHEFIPLDEIWVSTKHVAECGCKNVREWQNMSRPFIESTILHEIVECVEMKHGLPYWQAHQAALSAEMDAGILKDPYLEPEQQNS